MVKANRLLPVTALLVFAVLGLIGGFWFMREPEGLAQVGVKEHISPPEAPGIPTSTKLDTLRRNIDQAAAEERASGCTEWDDKVKRHVFCGTSKERMEALYRQFTEETKRLQQRDLASVAAVIANIRALAEGPSLDVTFGGTSENPYSSKHPRKRMELYGDNRGMVYYVDPDTNQVIQFGPGPNSVITDDKAVRLSEAELRQRAEDYLAKHVPNFAEVRRTFNYQEMSKSGRRFAFRWEAPAKAEGEEMAAFVQVVLSPSGKVISFNNTQTVYQTASQ